MTTGQQIVHNNVEERGLKEMANLLAVRDVYREVFATPLDELGRVKDDNRLMARHLVSELHTERLISADEEKLLSDIVEALYDETDIPTAVKRVESLYREILADQDASSLAIAIAFIGHDSINTIAKDKDGKDKKGGKGTSAADLAGALAGGNIGSKTGGIAGGVLGAVVGGVRMSYLARR